LKNKDVVHEVSRQHTYVLCQNAEAGTEHEANLLLICTECDTVTEIFEAQLSKPLKKFSKQYDFAINCSTVELTGVCQQCQA
jgi:Fur family zinc uptake transcriptional regulator